MAIPGHGDGDNGGDHGNPWEPRYTTARAMLDETGELLSTMQTIDDLATTPQPTAAMLSTADLAGARRVGVYAGSFNPLTLAHIALAEAAQRTAQLDLLIWLHAIVTVDKERVERALLPDRLAQLRAYARTTVGHVVAVCNRGLYVDQAAAIHEFLPPEAHLYLLIGFDKMLQIVDPRYYADRDVALAALFHEAQLLVAPRAQAGASDLAQLLARPEHARFAPFVHPIPLAPTYATDSSSQVRQLAATPEANHARLRALVPPEALALILETGAYSNSAPTGSTPPPHAATDAYTLRQHWLAALHETLPPTGAPRLPALSALVRASGASGEAAAAVRAWLARAPGHRTSAELNHILARLNFTA